MKSVSYRRNRRLCTCLRFLCVFSCCLLFSSWLRINEWELHVFYCCHVNADADLFYMACKHTLARHVVIKNKKQRS